MNIREFWLVNSRDEKITLTDRSNSIFLRNPSGLGYSTSFETVSLGINDKVESYSFNFEAITGELIFYGNDIKTIYQKYFEFMQFVAHNPLYFYYKTPNMNESYFSQVRIAKLEKSEISEDIKALISSVEFKRETLWKQGNPKLLVVENVVDGETKNFPLTRPYQYGQSALNNITIANNSICESPFSIEITGTCTDLQYSLYDEDLVLYGVGKIIGTYDYIYINSDDLNEQLILKQNGVTIENSFNYQDLSVGEDGNVEVTFLKLKTGKSFLTVSMNKDFDGKVNIKWSNYYATL